MSDTLSPATIEELADAVRSAPRVLAVGAETKPRLSETAAIRISTRRLNGIVEYEPSEFTFTALAGTPLCDIVQTLAERGQYLPFDPMLVEAGATLGGTVAAGLSGPGRFRYGGLRDFILCVKFVDGMGRVLRLGGKVVKNAAGFDVPKFMVGSLGRFGVLGEITFKVFPRVRTQRTLRLFAGSWKDAVRIFDEAGRSRLEFDALDVVPGSCDVLARLAATEVALDDLCHEALARWRGEVLPDSDAGLQWRQLTEFEWVPVADALVKVPLAPADVDPLGRAVELFSGARVHFSAAGNVAFVSVPRSELGRLGPILTRSHLRGLVLRGGGPLWLGAVMKSPVIAEVKRALDPDNRFPKLDD
jgi:glycolate oxidase FAD binding subunit